jgi:hypothetical protein
VDDQAQYNLLRYHLARAQICRKAIRRYNVALREAGTTFAETPAPYVVAWRNQVRNWQRLLEDQYQAGVTELAGYEASVLAAGDSVLVGQVRSLQPLPGQEPDRDPGNGPPGPPPFQQCRTGPQGRPGPRGAARAAWGKSAERGRPGFSRRPVPRRGRFLKATRPDPFAVGEGWGGLSGRPSADQYRGGHGAWCSTRRWTRSP